MQEKLKENEINGEIISYNKNINAYFNLIYGDDIP